MAASVSTLNMDILDLDAMRVMECPVCLEDIDPPVFQCQNGHVVCSKCLENITECPMCRVEMPTPRIRCLAVENFLPLKCPNFQFGCEVRLRPKDKPEHVLNCEYSSNSYCRCIGLENVGLPCNKIIRSVDIASHMKDDHMLTVLDCSETVISQELASDELKRVARKWFPITLFAFNNHFFVDSELIAEKDGPAARISWKCICAGSFAIAKQFFVKFTLFNPDKNISLKWKGSVISVDQHKERDLNYFSASLGTLNQFSRSLKKVKWTIKISVKRNLSTHQVNQASGVETVKMLSTAFVTPIEHQLIVGTYQFASGAKTNWEEIMYSVNGKRWYRKVPNLREYSFTFGEEVEYETIKYKVKTIVTIEGNKLIHKERLFKSGKFSGDRIRVEEFSHDGMVSAYTYSNGETCVRQYKRIK